VRALLFATVAALWVVLGIRALALSSASLALVSGAFAAVFAGMALAARRAS
jgi:hypothetical protein